VFDLPRGIMVKPSSHIRLDHEKLKRMRSFFNFVAESFGRGARARSEGVPGGLVPQAEPRDGLR
jgi:hypothetical protein